jgi:ankyrin repeat protein
MIVRALLDKGADTNAKFIQTNMNAMMLAVKHGYAEVIRLLQQAKSP